MEVKPVKEQTQLLSHMVMQLHILFYRTHTILIVGCKKSVVFYWVTFLLYLSSFKPKNPQTNSRYWSAFSRSWSFSLFSQPFLFVMYRYCWEKIDVGHSRGLNMQYCRLFKKIAVTSNNVITTDSFLDL